MVNIPIEIELLLKKMPFTYFCTVDEFYRPYITPMFFYFDEDTSHIFLITSPHSRKVANIQVNDKVSLTIDERDTVNPFNNRGVMIQGRAVIIDLQSNLSKELRSEVTRAYKFFKDKYATLSSMSLDQGNGSTFPRSEVSNNKLKDIVLRVIPKKITYWAEGPKFRTIEF